MAKAVLVEASAAVPRVCNDACVNQLPIWAIHQKACLYQRIGNNKFSPSILYMLLTVNGCMEQTRTHI